MAAIKAQKYVFCEKPLVPEAEACCRMEDLTMSVEAGLATSIAALEQTISK